jgi:hypothetical protein
MSALGQKQTFGPFTATSALPPKADIAKRDSDVRFVPKADIPRCSEDRRYSITSSARRLVRVLRLGGWRSRRVPRGGIFARDFGYNRQGRPHTKGSSSCRV